MDFILDAHLPPSICKLLIQKGHSAIHTKELSKGNDTSDVEISNVADQENRIVVTKDSDFYYSHLILSSPKKLLLVKTGNMGIRDTINLFDKYLDAIVNGFEAHNLIELHKDCLIY